MAIDVNSLRIGIHDCGPYAGSPCVFIHTGNLANSRTHKKWEVKNLIQEVLFLRDRMPFLSLVIRGTEPTSYEEMPDLIEGLSGHFGMIELTTNGGSADMYKLMQRQGTIAMFTTALAPRLSGAIYKRPESIILDHTTYIKFMISADTESKHHSVPEWAVPANSGKIVYVAPISFGSHDRPLSAYTVGVNTNYALKEAANYNLMVNLPKK